MSTETALMYAPEKGADAVELENPPEKTLASPEDGVPEAHAKIGLSVAIVIFAVLLIYFTQLLTLVGIGAVSESMRCLCLALTPETASNGHCCAFRRRCKHRVGSWACYDHDHYS